MRRITGSSLRVLDGIQRTPEAGQKVKQTQWSLCFRCVCVFSASAASCWEPYLNRHTARLHLPACISLNLTVLSPDSYCLHLQNPSHVFIHQSTTRVHSPTHTHTHTHHNTTHTHTHTHTHHTHTHTTYTHTHIHTYTHTTHTAWHILKIIRIPVESFFLFLLLEDIFRGAVFCLFVDKKHGFISSVVFDTEYIFLFHSAKVFNPGLNVNNSKQLWETAWWKRK